jgi:hypothetical protein
MNRREFFATTGAAAAVAALPLSAAAGSEFPLIGQPLIGLKFIARQWGARGEWFQDKWAKRFHSIKVGEKFTEVFLHKLRTNAFTGHEAPYVTNCPHAMAYAADTMIDMERYSLIKSRNTSAQYPFLKIPAGADRAKVIRNRIDHLDAMGYARDALGDIG